MHFLIILQCHTKTSKVADLQARSNAFRARRFAHFHAFEFESWKATLLDIMRTPRDRDDNKCKDCFAYGVYIQYTLNNLLLKCTNANVDIGGVCLFNMRWCIAHPQL